MAAHSSLDVHFTPHKLILHYPTDHCPGVRLGLMTLTMESGLYADKLRPPGRLETLRIRPAATLVSR
jgi:hypothetical protein